MSKHICRRHPLRRSSLAPLLFIGACQAVSSDRGSTDDDDLVSQRSALTASITLEQALSGRVVDATGDANGRIQAGIHGSADVADDGSAHYGFPIWTPDGINGLQPELSIAYSSGGGTSSLGPRWHVAGLSTITRCGKTRAQDGVQTAVDHFGDTFCLDGQRLIVVGSTASSSEFRTERDSYAKIVGFKDGNQDFERFVVYRRDGRILRFGSDVWSRLHGRPIVGSGQAPRDANYTFYVDKIEDRYGNAINFSYFHGTTSTGAARVQELQPSWISWGPYTVYFDYEPLPDGATVNPQVRWVRGMAIGAPTYLDKIRVVGPSGGGTAMVLKAYDLAYSTTAHEGGPAIITGDRVLSRISECDANDICKKPTVIKWTPGPMEHTIQDLGAGDFDFSAQPYTGGTYQPPPPEPATNNYSRFYRRIVAADVDGDGLDDFIYRARPTSGSCAGWNWRRTRLGSTASAPVSLAAPVVLGVLGSDPDPQCRSSFAPGGALGWPGDIIVADVDGDGYNDIVSPIGKTSSFQGNGQQQPILAGFRAYLNKALAAPGTFGPPINLLDSLGQPPSMANFPSTSRPERLAFGDIDGDGRPELVRSVAGGVIQDGRFRAAGLATSLLTAKTETRSGQTFPYLECLSTTTGCYKNLPGSNGSDLLTNELALLDIDGDGTAEVLRRSWCGISECSEVQVSSPTLNTTLSLPPSSHTWWWGRSTPARWFLDINGDGLSDIVWLDGSSWRTGINTGQGFTDFKTTTIPSGMMTGNWREALPIDYNLDGRHDLLLAVGTTTGKSAVLLSDGLGGFTLRDLDGPPIPPAAPDSLTGRIDRIVADLNGDGLPDVVQLETVAGVRRLIGYMRGGRPPVLVENITEGDGRSVTIGYDVTVVRPGSDFYVRTGTAVPYCADSTSIECLKRGRWVAKSLSTSDGSVTSTYQYKYSDGATDKHGRGFLGFRQRFVVGPDSSVTTFTYDHITRVADSTSFRYVYPNAMQPKTVVREVVESSPSKRHVTNVSSTHQAIWKTNGVYQLKKTSSATTISQCPVSLGSCTTIRSVSDTYVIDDFGNVTQQTTSHGTFSDPARRTDVENNYFLLPNMTDWLVSLHDPARPTTIASTAPAAPSIGGTVTVTRRVKLTPDTVHGGISSIEIEPTGNTDVRLLRSFSRDTLGRLTTVTDREFSASNETRTTTLEYLGEDLAHVSRITNPLGHVTRLWRHPGYGFLVEADDPNQLAATWTYDTFGRLLGQTELSGASVSIAHANNSGSGNDVTVTPGGAPSGSITIHLDASGRETYRVQPIDASRTTRVESEFDSLGRLKTRRVKTGTGANPTMVANTYKYTYDGLDRLTSSCHLPPGGATDVCEMRSYNNLNTTVTNEASRTTTHIANTLGQEAEQRVTRPDGTASTARFSFGPFGHLVEQKPHTLTSGRTTFTWDVLGRLAHTYRISADGTGPRGRGTAYNAFGEMTRSWKNTVLGPTEAQAIVYGRDSLGRITSMVGNGLARYFVWDGSTKGKGKLTRALDGSNVPSQANGSVYFEYESHGLLEEKVWSVRRNGTMTAIGKVFLSHDSQGRPESMRYQAGVVSASSDLVISYGYDDYLGDARLIRDETSGYTVWSADALNELGQITTERMRVPAGPWVGRNTSYYPQSGALQTRNLVGTNGTATLSYTYAPDGLPLKRELTNTSAGDGWSDRYGYDNLGQMTSWQPLANNTAGVNYEYDPEGNLVRRQTSLGNEEATYAASLSRRTTTVKHNGSLVRTDEFFQDIWGRVYDTPAAWTNYNDADEPVGIGSKATGVFETITRDALGSRIELRSDSSTLITLDDLYERRESTSTGLVYERFRLYANGRAIGDLVRNAGSQTFTATWELADNVGNVVAEASSSAVMSLRARRDPYGNLITDPSNPHLPTAAASSNPDGSGRMAFAGHARDAGWGLVDMKARLYSPTLGRFLSPDPIIANPLDRRDYNPFAYVRNSPTAYQDPDGRGPCSPDVPECIPTPDPGPEPRTEGGEGVPFVVVAGVAATGATGYLIYLGLSALFGDDPPPPPKVGTVSLPPAQAPNTSSNGGSGSANADLRGFTIMMGGGFRHIPASPPGKSVGPTPLERANAWAERMFDLAALGTYEDRQVAIQAGGEFGLEMVKKGFTPMGSLVGGPARAAQAATGGIRVTEKGLLRLEANLALLDSAPYNAAMVARLRSAMAAGKRVSGADANFYLHEIAEGAYRLRGLGYDAAHAAALGKYGASSFSLYHPEVIGAFPAYFNNAWRAFWEMP